MVGRAAPGGERHESLRYGARIELGLRAFLTDGGFTAFTSNFEDLGGLRQLPGLAVQRLMADGYGFGGEGDWKTSVLRAHPEGDGRGPARRHVVHGGLHLPPRARQGADARGPHARGLPDHRSSQAAVEIHPLGIGGREDPVRLVFDAAPGAAVCSASSDLGDRFRLVANEVTVVTPDAAAAEASGRPRGLAAGARPPYVHRGLADGRRPAPHGPVDRTHDQPPRPPRGDPRDRAGRSSARAPPSGRFRQELRWNSAYHRLAGGHLTARLGHGTFGRGTDPAPARKEWRTTRCERFFSQHRRRQPGARPRGVRRRRQRQRWRRRRRHRRRRHADQDVRAVDQGR